MNFSKTPFNPIKDKIKNKSSMATLRIHSLKRSMIRAFRAIRKTVLVLMAIFASTIDVKNRFYVNNF